MSVFDLSTVDSISVDEARRRVVLGLVVPGPILNDPALIDALSKKVNAYVSFVRSGQLERHYPPARELSAMIEVAHAGPLDAWALAMVRQLAGQLGGLGISLRTVDLEPPAARRGSSPQTGP
jgi:hypothetical protein